jgi:protein-disulfide isomerase
MKEIKLLNNLVVFVLFLSVLNIILVFDLYQKLGFLGGVENKKQVAGEQADSATGLPSKVQVSTDNDPVKGDKKASVTIIEFGDFQCSYCEMFATNVFPEIEKKYIKTGQVKFVYRDFPLSFHQYAQKAAEAAECADEQGKFWNYHDKLFQNQNSLDLGSLKTYAQQLGLGMTKFNDCLDAGSMNAEVQKDVSDGGSYGVSGTPAFFINGTPLTGAQPFEEFEKIIEQELKK